MSKEAPWLALSVDWQDSAMFDDAAHGVRLAWICLLCHVKAQGRAGKIRFRDKAFAAYWRLNGESVTQMVERATIAGAVNINGDTLTVVNWKSYQDPKARSRKDNKCRENKAPVNKRRHFTKTSTTKHPPPSTKHPPPPPPKLNPSFQGPEPLEPEWEAVAAELRKEGMGDATHACECARAKGVLVYEVTNALGHFRSKPGAWSIGLLYGIIKRMCPGQKITWPDPCPEFEAVKAKEKRQRDIAKQLKKREDHEAETARLNAERAAGPVGMVEGYQAALRGQSQ